MFSKPEDDINYYYKNVFRVVRKSGVKDKNGVEICEGDTVRYFRYNKKHHDRVDYSVVYGGGSFALEYMEDDRLDYYYFPELNFPEDLEIIN